MDRYHCFISLMVFSTGLTTSEVTIFPLLQVVAPNDTAMFNCSKRADTILINNSAYSNYFRDFINMGISFQNSTVKVFATKRLNNTIFQCVDSTMSSLSSKAVLIVAGLPSSPDPRILVINSTHLNVSWDSPFTQTGFGTLRYTVRVFNAVSKATVGSYEVVENHLDFSYSSSWFDCVTLTFLVTATNQIGESGAGKSCFPAVGLSLTPPEIHVAITNVGNGTFDAEILVKFPPEICWYPRINYSISMSRRSSGAAVLQTDAHDFEAHFGSFVVFTTDKLIANDVYFIVARIEVTGGFTGGFVAQTNSSIVMYLPHVTSSYLPHVTSTVAYISPQESPVPLGYWVGYVCMVIILFGTSVVLVGVFVCLRYRKQRKTSHQISTAVIPVDTKQETKLASSLVCNPIYAGAVYETIPGAHEWQNNFDSSKKTKRTSSVGVRSISSNILEESSNDYARREEWVNVPKVSNAEPRYTCV